MQVLISSALACGFRNEVRVGRKGLAMLTMSLEPLAKISSAVSGVLIRFVVGNVDVAFHLLGHPRKAASWHHGGDGRYSCLVPADAGVDDGGTCGLNCCATSTSSQLLPSSTKSTYSIDTR